MLAFLVYAAAITGALSMIAACLDHLAARRGTPRRLVWLLAMLCSTLLPPLLIFSADPEPASASIAAEVVLGQSGVSAPANPILALQFAPASISPAAVAMPTTSAGWHLPKPSGKSVLMAWTMVSGSLFAFLIGASALLRRRAVHWQRVLIREQEVLVTEDTGPALLGVLQPQILVPRWFMDEPATTQSLILEHEQQHIFARDPLLLRVTTLIAIAAPWNLPLWWQLKRLRLAIELDCDARVMRNGAEAGRYGEVLLGVTQRATAMPVGVIAMSEPVSALEQRIRCLSPVRGRHAVLRMIGVLSLAAAGIGAAAALEVPAFQQVAQAPVIRPASPATAAPATRAVPATPATPASDAAPAQQSGAESHVQIGVELQDSATIGNCAAARAWCRETAIRQAFARDAVIDDRKNKDGTYVDPLTFGKPICRVTRDGVPVPGTAGGTQIDLEALKALAKDCKPVNVFGTTSQADVVDLNKIPSNLLQRMEVVTDGKAAAYGSGAMAGVVNLVLNNRLKGFQLDPDCGVNPDQSTCRFSIGTRFPNDAPAATPVVDNFLVTIIPGENTRAVSPQVRIDQYVGEDTEVVTALVTMQVKGLWNPQILAGQLARLISPSGRLSETPDGTSLVVVDKVGECKKHCRPGAGSIYATVASALRV